jgi:hypothetical protein
VVGIDPGATGGMGVIKAGPPGPRQVGECVAAVRWDNRDPINIYNRLLLISKYISVVYLERANLFVHQHKGKGEARDREDMGLQVQGQTLLVSSGIWQGLLIAAGLWGKIVQVAPATWQAALGFWRWQARGLPSPLEQARQLWPGAPLECKVDEGRAVGLLLAELARRDMIMGISRVKDKPKKRKRVASNVKAKQTGAASQGFEF